MWWRQTTRQLIDRSRSFRLFFLSTIVLLVVATVLMVSFPFTSCGYYSTVYNNYSCSYYYSQYYQQCASAFDAIYCCTNASSQCGDSNCAFKPYITPTYYYNDEKCFGFLIAGVVCYSCGFTCAVFVLIIFRKLRAKALEASLLQINVDTVRPQMLDNGSVVLQSGDRIIVYAQQGGYQALEDLNRSEGSSQSAIESDLCQVGS